MTWEDMYPHLYPHPREHEQRQQSPEQVLASQSLENRKSELMTMQLSWTTCVEEIITRSVIRVPSDQAYVTSFLLKVNAMRTCEPIELRILTRPLSNSKANDGARPSSRRSFSKQSDE